MNSSVDRFSLQGRRALITGASKGIGAEIGAVYADAGAKSRPMIERTPARRFGDPVEVADMALYLGIVRHRPPIWSTEKA